MLNSKLLLFIALPLALYSVAAEAKLYKWVDENGETHYGEVIPPEYAGDKKVQIQRGMEVKEQPKAEAKSKPKEEAPQTPEEIERERHDKALLATYANEGEIDDALHRALQSVNARIEGLTLQLKSAQKDLDAVRKDGESNPNDKGLEAQIKQETHHVSNLTAALAAAQADADKIKARFQADKLRYRELSAPPK